MQLVNNELDCCYNSTISDNPAASHMCFYVRDMTSAASEYLAATEENRELLEYFSAQMCACLAARYVVGMKLCKSSEDCRIANSTVSFCAFPALLGNMSFMRITLKRNAPVMLYT
ncbi:unnamed protein product [Gongylonema pulchrum]|uniref:Gnk2-homologous domain-containing protein n=1 Tax=Gongylonema pulchrum TaxID=637853 RepID=A0A183EL13_9BILA|nr:unnamed protein product [Gongylonema pulchrum]